MHALLFWKFNIVCRIGAYIYNNTTFSLKKYIYNDGCMLEPSLKKQIFF